DAGAAMYCRDVEGGHGNFSVFEIDQLFRYRGFIQVLIPLGLLGFLPTGMGIVTVILLHVVSAQYTVYALAPHTAELMAIGRIPGMQHRIAAMETPRVFRSFGSDSHLFSVIKPHC